MVRMCKTWQERLKGEGFIVELDHGKQPLRVKDYERRVATTSWGLSPVAIKRPRSKP
jgi:hypothetical protein